MRIGQTKLIFLALRVLMELEDRAKAGPFQPGAEARLALAVLYSFSRSGHRDLYDRFWRNLYDQDEPAGGISRPDDRSTRALRVITQIIDDVCPPDLRQPLWSRLLTVCGRPQGPVLSNLPPRAEVSRSGSSTPATRPRAGPRR